MDLKKTAHISNTPYFRGYTLPTPADRSHGQVIENFQFGFEEDPVCAHDEVSAYSQTTLHWPQHLASDRCAPGFRPLIEDITHIISLADARTR